MRSDQDIYGLDVTEVIIRFSSDNVEQFNHQNAISIDQIKANLHGKENTCYFQKLSEDEHRVTVSVLEGQIEFVVVEHDLSGTYEAIVQKKQKTTYKPAFKLPDEDKVVETCTIRIIDLNEGGKANRASDEFEELLKKVSKLNAVSAINVANQQEIWQKWIEAQGAIVASLQKPFQVKGTPPVLQEVKNNNGDISRYTLKFDLAKEFLPEYRQLENKLKTLGIEEGFDAEGSIQLTRNQLPILDEVIRRFFPETLERSPIMGAIIGIRPLTLAQKIQVELPEGTTVSQNATKKLLFVSGKPTAGTISIMRSRGFEFKSYSADFKILNHGNIIENETINKEFSIYFGSQFVKPNHVKELLLPFPDENTFRFSRSDYADIHHFHRTLAFIYGPQNIEKKISSVFEQVSDQEIAFLDSDFPEEFWKELKRNLFLHNMEEAVNSFSKTIYLEFQSEEELEQQFSILKNIKTFDLIYSPLEEDFRFKVKTNVISKKNEKDLFLEKLKLLRGAEFVVEVATEEIKRPMLVYLGKLDGNESDLQKLVLNIPNFFPGDKEKAKLVLEFLKKEDRPMIKEIRANLAGDATKLSWLQKTINKIVQPTEAPNGRPVNERLGEFVFDTSKATPIHDPNKVKQDSEYYWQVRNNELLRLNESQRKAVLAAIYCSDIALLQGPPGTGKTTVIAEIIWQIICSDPKHKILLTSETNLAVDNALDRLLNTKGVNKELARYTTLIKPLRFGQSGKIDEEGARYSVDRILKWQDESYQIQYESLASIEDQDDELDEEDSDKNYDNNAVRVWMERIASRSKANDPKYAEALKDWALDLSYPTLEIKKIFTDKYFEYANVVGSTCSSSGSPRFMWDYATAFSDEEVESMKKWNYRSQTAPFGKDYNYQLNKIDLPLEKRLEFQTLIRTYQDENRLIKQYYGEEGRDLSKKIESESEVRQLKTIDGKEIKSEKDSRNLLSYQRLTDFGKQFVAPFFEPRLLFDTVIMDEASKATPPELVLPLCFGKRSIVIGDHRQLPPMLNEKDLKEALIEADAANLIDEIEHGFTETSQFERMILNKNVSPTIISRCNIQYRMHPDINNVISQFYTNEDEGDMGLYPAQELIDNANDSNLNNIFSRYHGFYVPNFINSNIHTIWVDVKSPELREGTSVVNEGEAKAVRKVLELIKQAEGFEAFQNYWDLIKDEQKRKQEKEIGVISFYGAQKRLLKKSLSGLGPLKINTVDRFQGMERNIIIVSTVRSNKQVLFGGKIGINRDSGFAKSPQRLNVALSRARRLLIVVGNKDFFEQVTDKNGRPLYKNAIEQIKKSGQIIDFELLNK